MHSRWYNAAVILLWLATMSWLVTKKVLPSLLVGEPPSTSRIIAAGKDRPPVGWHILFNRRPLGWAISEVAPQPTGLTEIHGRVHFDNLPLGDMLKGWLKAFSRFIGPLEGQSLDARSRVDIDALGQLVGFDSAVRLDPLAEILRVRGTVEDRQLRLEVITGGATLASESFLPSDALLTDALSPQTDLGDSLRIGQKWTVPIYSPLFAAKNPIEIIQAKVEEVESIRWDDRRESCWLVVYRNDPGSGMSGNDKPRGRVWVRRDGAVLKQEANLFDSVITFERLSDAEAATLVQRAGPEWWIMNKQFSRLSQ